MFHSDGFRDLGPRWPAEEPVRYIGVAGIPVPVRSVVGLIGRLRESGLHETAEKLIDAWAREERMVSLEGLDREALLHVLLHDFEGLAVLRAVLLREHVRHRAEGL
jgi:hypothetical protein